MYVMYFECICNGYRNVGKNYNSKYPMYKDI